MITLHSGLSTSRLLAAMLGRDFAVDLGTATTRLVAGGNGRFVEGPSVYGSTPALARGVVVDPEAAAALLDMLLRRARRLIRWRPRLLACVPTDATPAEYAAVAGSLRAAGASAITVVPEPLAAAIGAGLDVASRFAQMVVDIGHGVTDCAVIRSGQVVTTRAVRRACSDLYAALDAAAIARHGACLPPGEAQRLVARLGVAGDPGPGTIELRVRRARGDRTEGVAMPVRDLVRALEPEADTIVAVVRDLLRELPADTGAEIIENGILLTGGGALLPGMRARIEAATGIAVRAACDPLHAVIRGARAILPTVVENDLWQR